MKLASWLIALSLAANLLLAGWWMKTRAIRPAPRPATAIRPGPAGGPGAIPTQASSEAAPAPGGTSVGLPAKPDVAFAWRDIATDDLKDFIRRLRAAGCPEETIQDMIVAEVNRRYRARYRELWPSEKEWQFWKTQRDPVENKKNRERSRQSRELEKEKSGLLVQLLGVDPEKERRKAEGLPDWSDWRMARIDFVPEDKREAVAKFLDEFDEKSQDFYDRNRGLYDAQYRAEQRQLEAEKLQGLAQFLTPQELREYELRQSQLGNQLSYDLRELTVTREQYEDIFDIRKKYGDSIFNYGDVETAAARSQVEETRKAMLAEMAVALGPDKAREYERSQDHAYQELARLAKRSELPGGTASKVYDYKQAAEQTVKQLKDDTSLTFDQREAALQKIRAETEKTVKETLGETAYKRYLSSGGWWINNLAPAQRRPAPRPQ